MHCAVTVSYQLSPPPLPFPPKHHYLFTLDIFQLYELSSVVTWLLTSHDLYSCVWSDRDIYAANHEILRGSDICREFTGMRCIIDEHAPRIIQKFLYVHIVTTHILYIWGDCFFLFFIKYCNFFEGGRGFINRLIFFHHRIVIYLIF